MEQDPLKEPQELEDQENKPEVVLEYHEEEIFPIEELFIEEIQEKKPIFSYMLIGFFVPILGYIFYYMYKKDNKRVEADSFLDGAMIGTFTFILVILLVIGYILSS